MNEDTQNNEAINKDNQEQIEQTQQKGNQSLTDPLTSAPPAATPVHCTEAEEPISNSGNQAQGAMSGEELRAMMEDWKAKQSKQDKDGPQVQSDGDICPCTRCERLAIKCIPNVTMLRNGKIKVKTCGNCRDAKLGKCSHSGKIAREIMMF